MFLWFITVAIITALIIVVMPKKTDNKEIRIEGLEGTKVSKPGREDRYLKKEHVKSIKEEARKKLTSSGYHVISCFVSFRGNVVWGYAKRRGQKYKYNIRINELHSCINLEPQKEYDDLDWIDRIEEMETFLE